MAIIRDPVPAKEIVTMSRDLESLFVLMLEEILENLDNSDLNGSIDVIVNDVLSIMDE